MADVSESTLAPRSAAWKWAICGLLLLATMLNYMDRLTLNLLSADIMQELKFDDLLYGQLESGFAYAFALGAILMGWLADRWNVRWLYPAAVLAWSAAGFATGLVTGFVGLLACRFFLGLAEAGHWPCALRTTQRVLSSSERSLGNSILQSGAAFGAILTPLIIIYMVAWTGSWRSPFLIIGALGTAWAVAWLLSIRASDLALEHVTPSPSLMSILGWLMALLAVDMTIRVLTHPQGAPADTPAVPAVPWAPLAVKAAIFILGAGGVCWWYQGVSRDEDKMPRPLYLRRFAALMIMVVTINITWHYLRAWLPLFLRKQHGYSSEFTGSFLTVYAIATDVGTLSSGFVALTLSRRGLSVHASRSLVFLFCALLTLLTVLAAVLPSGYLLLGVLMVIGFASLGQFPLYYSFSQELTERHQGKLTGSLSCINWLAMYLMQELAGASAALTGSYSPALALAGLAPLAGLAAMVLLWGKEPEPLPVATEN